MMSRLPSTSISSDPLDTGEVKGKVISHKTLSSIGADDHSIQELWILHFV